MTAFRDRAVEALRAGQNAKSTDRNPYDPAVDPLLAKVWRRGFETMLTIRESATPARQRFLQSLSEEDGAD